MAVQAENLCFENMGFVPFGMCSSQDLVMGDSFYFQESGSNNPFLSCSNNLVSSSSSSISCNAPLPVEFLQYLSSDLEKQRFEVDGYLQLENHKLRRFIQQAQTHQFALLSQKFESRITTLMLQKDQKLAIARNRTTELQHLLKNVEAESKAWEKKAIEKEAVVFDLNNKLNKFSKKRDCDDIVSFCDSSSSNRATDMSCKLCHIRKSCVVFFPCRHICCCKSCDVLLGHCLVCETGKEASLEVFLD